MALANAVQGARHTAQTITWKRDDGVAVNLTGATLTGRLRDLSTGVERDMDGTLVLVTAVSGIFRWTYGAIDVGMAGAFEAQFIATFTDSSKDISYIEEWNVEKVI